MGRDAAPKAPRRGLKHAEALLRDAWPEATRWGLSAQPCAQPCQRLGGTACSGSISRLNRDIQCCTSKFISRCLTEDLDGFRRAADPPGSEGLKLPNLRCLEEVVVTRHEDIATVVDMAPHDLSVAQSVSPFRV